MEGLIKLSRPHLHSSIDATNKEIVWLYPIRIPVFGAQSMSKGSSSKRELSALINKLLIAITINNNGREKERGGGGEKERIV